MLVLARHFSFRQSARLRLANLRLRPTVLSHSPARHTAGQCQVDTTTKVAAPQGGLTQQFHGVRNAPKTAATVDGFETDASKTEAMCGRADTAILRLCRDLDLQPHPEGGYYRETYRYPKSDKRAAISSIYYLLASNQVSRLHRIDAVELWHHHEGAAVQIWELLPAGPRATLLGVASGRGEVRQHMVRPGVCLAPNWRNLQVTLW